MGWLPAPRWQNQRPTTWVRGGTVARVLRSNAHKSTRITIETRSGIVAGTKRSRIGPNGTLRRIAAGNTGKNEGFSEITIQIEMHFAMTFVVGSIIGNWHTELTPRLPVGKTGHDIAKLTGVKQKKPRPKLLLAQRRSNLKGLTNPPADNATNR